MTFWDWIGTPQGIAVTHAVVLLLTSTAAILGAIGARISTGNRKLLNGHLREHQQLVSQIDRATTSSGFTKQDK